MCREEAAQIRIVVKEILPSTKLDYYSRRIVANKAAARMASKHQTGMDP